MKIDINEALKRQASKEIDEQLEKFNMQIVTQIAVCLHRFEGFGNKRLKQFFENLVTIQKETTEKWMLEEDDVFFLCERYLRENKIDLSELLDIMNEEYKRSKI